MTGAHYEIVRRSIEGCGLPPIQKLRELLRKEWRRVNCLDCDDAVKKWPLYVINGGSNLSPLLPSMPLLMS